MKRKDKKGHPDKLKGFSSVGDVLEGFQTDEGKQSLPLEYSRDKQSLPLEYSRDKQSLPLEYSRDKQSLPLEYSRDKYISHEFQKYGYELAKELGDLKNKSLYIKLAKETPRGLLEEVKSFIKDAEDVRNKAALFLWKLTELKKLKATAKKPRG